MSFVARELERLSRALGEGAENPRYPEIYAAQQALSWALEPQGFAAPYAMLLDIPEVSGDCSAPVHQPQS